MVPSRTIFWFQVEPFLVPGRTVSGKGSTRNPKRFYLESKRFYLEPKRFYLEPKGFYLEPKMVPQMVLLWGQPKNPFRFMIVPFFF